MERLVETDAQFHYYSRPGEEIHVTHEKFGDARLPAAFTHWSYVATGGQFIVVDVQGWRIGKGKYIMTDPIVFSKVANTLGLVDWGETGMKSYIEKKHKCNEVC